MKFNMMAKPIGFNKNPFTSTAALTKLRPLKRYATFTLMSLIFGILLSACANEESYTLNGSALGYDDGTEMVLFELDFNSNSIPKDTLVVQGGRFTATYPYDPDMHLNYLQVAPGRSHKQSLLGCSCQQIFQY